MIIKILIFLELGQKEFQDDNNLDGGFINKRPDDYNEIKKFFPLQICIYTSYCSF